jgi:flagellar biosynthesis component FlhA
MTSPLKSLMCSSYFKHSLIGAICVTFSVLFLVAPLPNWLLDVGVGFSWAGSVSLLLVVALSPHPLDVPQVPKWMMGLTIGRLCLNISTTRAILNTGSGGGIIDEVGVSLIGNRWGVGVIFFIALMVIQYVVIARGVERIAQVTARFALEALPGAQHAISEAVARGEMHPEAGRRARLELNERSELCGALDGVMRFMKGDALAALILVMINGLGGVAIGVYHDELTTQQALLKYTQLTIGDGLLAQLPALLCAGAISWFVTLIPTSSRRASSSGEPSRSGSSSHREINPPQPLPYGMMGAGLSLIIFACLPLWRLETRLTLLGVALFLWCLAERSRRTTSLSSSSWVLSLHPVIVNHLSSPQEIVDRLSNEVIRRGLPRRSIQVEVSDIGLSPSGYALSIDGQQVHRGAVRFDHVFQIVTDVDDREGIPHPRWGIDGVWRQKNKEGIELSAEAHGVIGGLTPVDFIVYELIQVWRTHQLSAWSVEDVWRWLNDAPETLKGVTMNARLELISIAQLMRSLSRSGVALHRPSALLEHVTQLEHVPQPMSGLLLSPEEHPTALEPTLAKRVDQFRKSLMFNELAPATINEPRIPYILIESDHNRSISPDLAQDQFRVDWDELGALVIAALGRADYFIIVTERSTRRLIEGAVHLRAPDIPVLSWDELPSTVDLYQVGWMVCPQALR